MQRIRYLLSGIKFNSFELTLQQYLTPGWVSSSGCTVAIEPISLGTVAPTAAENSAPAHAPKVVQGCIPRLWACVWLSELIAFL